jgi:hypothetical protein
VIRGSKIEELEPAVHSRVTSLGAAGLVRLDGAIDLTSNVRELLDQAQRLPSPGG